MKWVLLVAVAVVAWAEPPAAVMELLSTAQTSLAEQDGDAFLGHFDSAMPGYQALRSDVFALIAAEGAMSTTDLVDDTGDDAKRVVKLDWVLRVGFAPAKRAVVTVTVQKRGREWKITGLDPLDFFKPVP